MKVIILTHFFSLGHRRTTWTLFVDGHEADEMFVRDYINGHLLVVGNPSRFRRWSASNRPSSIPWNCWS